MTVVKARIGSAWVPLTGGSGNLWDTAWGVIGQSVITAAHTGITALTVINGSPVTVQSVAGRRYKIAAMLAPQASDTASNWVIELRRGGVTVMIRAANTPTASNSQTSYVEVYLNETVTGLRTYDVAIRLQMGSGTVGNYADAGLVTSYLTVEDVGPVVGSMPVPNPTPTWTAPTFENGWRNYGAGYSLAGYRKIGDIVYLRGLVMSGTVNAPVFSLPSGFRPPNTLIFAVDGNPSQHVRCDVLPSGSVQFATGNSLHTSLDGVQFSITP